MKSSKWILVLWLGSVSWAQTSPQKAVNPPLAAKPSVANAPSPQNVRVQSVKAPAKPLPSSAKPAAARPSAGFVAQSSNRPQRGRRRAAQPHSAGTAALASRPGAIKSRRDPFVSPVVEHFREVAACNGSGRQCLLVGEISLRGVVRSPSGFIAVVVNGEHTYFLRENDPLADGAVERITNDEIILRERSSDALGRPLTREVTKKLGVTPAV